MSLLYSDQIVNTAVLLLPSVFKGNAQQLFIIDKVKCSVSGSVII